MPIRPIDMQVAVPRVSEVKEAKPNFLHREDLSRDGANNAMQKDMLKQKETVMEMESTAKSKVDDRKKKQKEESKKNNKKGEDEGKNSKKKSTDGTYHQIDIKV